MVTAFAILAMFFEGNPDSNYLRSALSSKYLQRIPEKPGHPIFKLSRNYWMNFGVAGFQSK